MEDDLRPSAWATLIQGFQMKSLCHLVWHCSIFLACDAADSVSMSPPTFLCHGQWHSLYRARSPPRFLTFYLLQSWQFCLFIAQAIWATSKIVYLSCIATLAIRRFPRLYVALCCLQLFSHDVLHNLAKNKSFKRLSKSQASQPLLQWRAQHVPTLEKTHCLMCYNQQGQALYCAPCSVFNQGMHAAAKNLCPPLAPHGQIYKIVAISWWLCGTRCFLCCPACRRHIKRHCSIQKWDDFLKI